MQFMNFVDKEAANLREADNPPKKKLSAQETMSLLKYGGTRR